MGTRTSSIKWPCRGLWCWWFSTCCSAGLEVNWLCVCVSLIFYPNKTRKTLFIYFSCGGCPSVWFAFIRQRSLVIDFYIGRNKRTVGLWLTLAVFLLYLQTCKNVREAGPPSFLLLFCFGAIVSISGVCGEREEEEGKMRCVRWLLLLFV